jgi:hypothetical protein
MASVNSNACRSPARRREAVGWPVSGAAGGVKDMGRIEVLMNSNWLNEIQNYLNFLSSKRINIGKAKFHL